MDSFSYYHYCAKGADARNFILCEADFMSVFNIIAVCAAVTGAIVVSFSIEDTHPHILLYGTLAQCARFKVLFEKLCRCHAVETREGGADFVLQGELYSIGEDLSYLRNVAVYTIIQATKDGKQVMPYDYRWGTGSMYFRSGFYTPGLAVRFFRKYSRAGPLWRSACTEKKTDFPLAAILSSRQLAGMQRFDSSIQLY